MQRTGCTRLDRGTRVPDDRVHCRTASQAFQITRYTAGRPHSVPDNWVHCRTAPQAFQITGCTLPDGLTSVPENWASPGKQWPQDSLFLLMEGGQQGWGSRLWDLRKLADKDTQSPWLLLFSLLLAGPVLPKHMAAFTDIEDFTVFVEKRKNVKLTPRAFISCTQRLRLMLVISQR